MKDYTTMLTDRPVDGLLLVTFNSPDTLNAIGPDMLDELDDLFGSLMNDEETKVVVFTGAGRGFCAGADLGAAAASEGSVLFSDPERFLKLVQERFASIVLNIRRIPQVVISAVNGPCAGGGFCMALASDVRIAAPEAVFVASFINIGLSGGELGTTYLLPRLIGLSRASEILYSGRKVTGEEAEKIGLVTKLVPKEKLVDEALAVAAPILQKSFPALKFTKVALNQNVDAPTLEAAVNLENRNQALMVFSGTFFEMVKHFIAQSKK